MHGRQIVRTTHVVFAVADDQRHGPRNRPSSTSAAFCSDPLIGPSSHVSATPAAAS